MLMMRLQRIGRKNNPAYRVVVTDSRRGPKSGRNIDLVGTYNPKLGDITIDADKVKHWMSNGVQVSDTVHNMLVSKKIIEGTKINALPKKAPIVDEEAIAKQKEEEEAAKAAAEAEAPADSEDAPAPETESEEAPQEDSSEDTKEEVADEKKAE